MLMPKKIAALVTLLVATSVLGACGDDDATSAGETRTAANGDQFNDSDVAFASDMIQHHAQALGMVDLTMGRRIDPDVQQVAEEIRADQGPEIERMTDWLTAWDQPVPETVRDHANAHGDGEMEMNSDMPGMMSAGEMADLEAAQGARFEDMWLGMMIEHHQGAIEMARSEQSEGEHAAARALAEDVESAQQEQISTMQDLLGS